MEVMRMGWCDSHSSRKVRTKKRIPRKSSTKKGEFNGEQNLESRRRQKVVISPTLHLRKRRKKAVVDVGACPYNLRPATAPALASEDSCVILSDSEDEYQGFDKGPEARRQKYGIMAVDWYNKGCSNKIELVETGPLAVGYIPTGRILHFNFKAKLKHDPHAPVLTFFSEITKTNRSVVTVHSLIDMGPTHLLPEEADTRGCLYCYSHNIHHPDLDDTFRRGANPLYTTLFSQIRELNTSIEEGFKKAEEEEALFNPKFSHPGVKYLGKGINDTTFLADVALHVFNETEGTNFELVKEGPIGQGKSGLGFIKHINFEAKNKTTDPGVPVVQTFFAQLIRNRLFLFTNFCKCLGPSDSLPDKVDLCGCNICGSNRVHHPPGSGYLLGRSDD